VRKKSSGGRLFDAWLFCVPFTLGKEKKYAGTCCFYCYGDYSRGGRNLDLVEGIPWICCRRNREELRDGRSEKREFGGLIMNIGMLFVMILGGAAGLLSTFYIVVSLFAVIIYKFYRKVKYGKKMYD
jgi:hypothetical protein